MENRKNYQEANYLGAFVENFIIIAIVFALVITVLDEFATVLEFSLPARNKILILSCATDVIFTIEFIARLIVTGRNGAARHYLVHQRGWIDLISSVPLLVLSSGPEVLLMLNPDLFGPGAGLGFMSSIKIVKAVRVSRILRLLRLLKIMGKIHNTDSQMANRHIAVISTIATMAFIVVYSFMAFAGITGGHDIEHQQEVFARQLAKNIQAVAEKPAKMAKPPMATKDKTGDGETAERAKELLTALMFQIDTRQSNIAQVYYKGNLLLSTISDEQLKSHYKYSETAQPDLRFKGDGHVHPVKEGDVIIYLNTWPLAKERARINIMVFFGIVAILLSFMFIYSRHFVQNVTDVVHIMQKGINDQGFNLEVSIRKDFEQDEIFQLARSYNETLLPDKMKNKSANADTDTGGLSLDDFMK